VRIHTYDFDTYDSVYERFGNYHVRGAVPPLVFLHYLDTDEAQLYSGMWWGPMRVPFLLQ